MLRIDPGMKTASGNGPTVDVGYQNWLNQRNTAELSRAGDVVNGLLTQLRLCTQVHADELRELFRLPSYRVA